ncbi:MAG TPA: hypothetical protein VGO11_00830 [Chthoniobacteraceae bacterium]|jgi:pimeloyl-ACP methyl ester carboxylesterase|nr:hypothetical protein [Chthoniobacteraceae bacterium]
MTTTAASADSTVTHESHAVFFCAGRDSGPWPDQIMPLVAVARARGFFVESLDFTGVADPDLRAEQLRNSRASEFPCLILAGRSMGGYVATVAAETLKPAGLFLLAPALYLEGYRNQDPHPQAGLISVVHAWQDELVPAEHSLRFARQHHAQLHLISGDHGLAGQMPYVASLFGFFLDEACKEATPPQIAHKLP